MEDKESSYSWGSFFVTGSSIKDPIQIELWELESEGTFHEGVKVQGESQVGQAGLGLL